MHQLILLHVVFCCNIFGLIAENVKSNVDTVYVANDGINNGDCGSVDSPCRSLFQAVQLNASSIVVNGDRFDAQRAVSLNNVSVTHSGTSIPFYIVADRVDLMPHYFTCTGTVSFSGIAFGVPHGFFSQQALIHSEGDLSIVNCSFLGYSVYADGIPNYHMVWVEAGTAVINATSFENLSTNGHVFILATAACVVDINQLSVSNVTLYNYSHVIKVSNLDDDPSSALSSFSAVSSSSSSFSPLSLSSSFPPPVSLSSSSSSVGRLSVRSVQVSKIVANRTAAAVLSVRASFAASFYTLVVSDVVIDTVSFYLDSADLSNAGDVVPMVVGVIYDTQEQVVDGNKGIIKVAKGGKVMTNDEGILISNTRIINVRFTLHSPMQSSSLSSSPFPSPSPSPSSPSSSASFPHTRSHTHTHTHTRSNTFTIFPLFPWPLSVLTVFSTPGFSPFTDSDSTPTSTTATASASAAASASAPAAASASASAPAAVAVTLQNTTISHRVDVGVGGIAPAYMPASAALHVVGEAVVVTVGDDVSLKADNAQELADGGYPSYGQNVICRDGAVLRFEKWNNKSYDPQLNQSLWIDGFSTACTIQSPYADLLSPLCVPVLTGVDAITAPDTSLVLDPTTRILAVVFKGSLLLPVNASFELIEVASTGRTLSAWPVYAVAPSAVPEDASGALREALLTVDEATYGAVVPPELGDYIAASRNEWRALVWFGVETETGTLTGTGTGTETEAGTGTQAGTGSRVRDEAQPAFLTTASFLVRLPVVSPSLPPVAERVPFTRTGGFAVLMVFVVAVLVGVVITVVCVVRRMRKKKEEGYSDMSLVGSKKGSEMHNYGK